MTGEAPKNSVVIEVTGHQFGWEFRYPGADKILGKKDYRLSKGANSLGVDFNDPASLDDMHVPATVHIPVGRPVKFVINAQDVIHDVGCGTRYTNYFMVYPFVYYRRNESTYGQS